MNDLDSVLYALAGTGGVFVGWTLVGFYKVRVAKRKAELAVARAVSAAKKLDE